MANLILRTWNASRGSDGGLQVEIMSAKPEPFERRTVEIKSTADAMAALDAYKADAAACGAPLVVSLDIKRGDRAPAGYRAATAKPYYHPVNV